jgi:hypothetical protein
MRRVKTWLSIGLLGSLVCAMAWAQTSPPSPKDVFGPRCPQKTVQIAKGEVVETTRCTSSCGCTCTTRICRDAFTSISEVSCVAACVEVPPRLVRP